MLLYSMSVSVDGYITDRAGGFEWTLPDEEQFRFHLARVRELGAHLCCRSLYQTMLPWETDPSLRDSELGPNSLTSGVVCRRSSSAAHSTVSRATPDLPRRR